MIHSAPLTLKTKHALTITKTGIRFYNWQRDKQVNMDLQCIMRLFHGLHKKLMMLFCREILHDWSMMVCITLKV